MSEALQHWLWPLATHAMAAAPGLGAWLLQLRASRREDRAADAAARDDVIDALREGLEEQRTELTRLRGEVMDARDAETRCRERLMEVREEVLALRSAMQRAGLPVPPMSGTAPA